MFRFTSIPCGTYKLVPFYNCENTVFDVSPPSLLVPAEHDHAIVPQRFQVTGFSIGGRVVDGNGVGVYHAKIIVDGHERSITDKEGYYMLDQVTSKRYSIEAKKQHYKFEKLSDFLDIFVRLQIWNLVVSVFGFSSTTELVFGIYLLYYFRVFDRQIGYNKYTIDKAPGSGVL